MINIHIYNQEESSGIGDTFVFRHGHHHRSEKSRQRNREHAKNTRIRKKSLVDSMISRLEELRAEGLKLHQMIDERSTARILLHLGLTDSIITDDDDTIEEELLLQEDLVSKLKTSVYAEVANTCTPTSVQHILSEEMTSPHTSADDSCSESSCDPTTKDKLIRKKRNRMHAKQSRDRRKLFAQKISELIDRVENHNSLLLKRLNSYYGGHSPVSVAKLSRTDSSSSSEYSCYTGVYK